MFELNGEGVILVLIVSFFWMNGWWIEPVSNRIVNDFSSFFCLVPQENVFLLNKHSHIFLCPSVLLRGFFLVGWGHLQPRAVISQRREYRELVRAGQKNEEWRREKDGKRRRDRGRRGGGRKRTPRLTAFAKEPLLAQCPPTLSLRLRGSSERVPMIYSTAKSQSLMSLYTQHFSK